MKPDAGAKPFVLCLLSPLWPALLAAGLLRGATLLDWLPEPWPALDMDRTVLTHKTRAARTQGDQDALFIGDSSCLMNALPEVWKKQTGRSAYNFGTLSYLDLEAMSGLLNAYFEQNPGSRPWIILLMHPEALRSPAASHYHTQALRRLLARRDFRFRTGAAGQIDQILGLETLRARVLSRIIPPPLTGEFRRHYGFTWNLIDSMKDQEGSALDPNDFHLEEARGSREYRLASNLQGQSRLFREALPEGVRVAVGITPLPEGFVDPVYPEKHQDMLRQWAEWLEADKALTGLPAVLPDELFATKTHLNRFGAIAYTRLLARPMRTAFARGAASTGGGPLQGSTNAAR